MRKVVKERPWFEKAFRKSYLDVYPHRDLDSARAEVKGLVERGVAGLTLDLGCGFGRHSLALREREVEAIGLDLSLDLLRAACELAGGEALAGRLVRGDFLHLPFVDGGVDTVLLLFSSFGYFDDETNRHVLDEACRVLAPRGLLVVDLMNPEKIRRTLVPESTTERGGVVLHERRRLEEWGRRVVKEVHLVDREGREHTWHEDVRLYGPNEFKALLRARGLSTLRIEGDFDGSERSDDSPRQIHWAEKS